jgi:hypothetical protein
MFSVWTTGDRLLPGLIDSHVHIWTRPVLERSLAFGVTTVLDMFMRLGDARAFRKQADVGAPADSDILRAVRRKSSIAWARRLTNLPIETDICAPWSGGPLSTTHRYESHDSPGTPRVGAPPRDVDPNRLQL